VTFWQGGLADDAHGKKGLTMMHGGEERGMTACYDMILIISIELLNYPIFFLLKSIFLFFT
jgi:hypothetical protein